MFEVATINRNKFIGFFLLFSLASILHDITHRSKGMKDVLNIVENTGAYFANSLAQAKSSLRDKPLSRCENCTKTPEDIGQGVRFMVCSTCRLKLKFEVHYCSQCVVVLQSSSRFMFLPLGSARTKTGPFTRRLVARRKFRKVSAEPRVTTFGNLGPNESNRRHDAWSPK